MTILVNSTCSKLDAKIDTHTALAVKPHQETLVRLGKQVLLVRLDLGLGSARQRGSVMARVAATVQGGPAAPNHSGICICIGGIAHAPSGICACIAMCQSQQRPTPRLTFGSDAVWSLRSLRRSSDDILYLISRFVYDVIPMNQYHCTIATSI